jgi:hypothetical protein
MCRLRAQSCDVSPRRRLCCMGDFTRRSECAHSSTCRRQHDCASFFAHRQTAAHSCSFATTLTLSCVAVYLCVHVSHARYAMIEYESYDEALKAVTEGEISSRTRSFSPTIYSLSTSRSLPFPPSILSVLNLFHFPAPLSFSLSPSRSCARPPTPPLLHPFTSVSRVSDEKLVSDPRGPCQCRTCVVGIQT